MKLLVQLICAFIGTGAFAVVFHIKVKRILSACVGGALAWLIYSLVLIPTGDIFVASAAAAGAGTIYAEILARITKTPATVYLIPSILPLVPGGSLYYATSALVINENAQFKQYSLQTVLVALSIAIGIITVTILTVLLNQRVKNQRSVPEEQS